jgi:NO-binding membrane sensor protein with MHYT domain
VLQVHSFAYGPLIPVVGYVASCLGLFLGLRCTTRARASEGGPRTRWLLLAGVSIGSVGVWAMDFLSLLGFSVAGETSRYSVPVVIASLLVAVAVTGSGLLIVGLGRDESRALPLGGLIVGLGLAGQHYVAMAAMRMPGQLSYDPLLFILSIAIAIVAATATLWAAVRLRALWPTLGVSLNLGIALCGMHYTAMAAVRVARASGPAGLVFGGGVFGGGATAESYLLPVILGVSIVSFLVWAAVALSPTEDAMRYDAALIDHIRKQSEQAIGTRAVVLRPPVDGDQGHRADDYAGHHGARSYGAHSYGASDYGASDYRASDYDSNGRAATDSPATDRAATDSPATDRPATKHAATDSTAANRDTDSSPTTISHSQ